MHRYFLSLLITVTLSTADSKASTSDDATADVAAAVTAFESGVFEDAERILLGQLADANDDHRAGYELARTYVAMARYQTALETIDRALAIAPHESRYHRLRGEALGRLAQEAAIFKQLGLAKRGLVAFEKAVALDPSNVAARNSLMEYYLQAPGMIGGSLKKAKQQADGIGDVIPAKGWRAHGRIHRYRNEVMPALTHYRAAVEADPNDNDIRFDFGTYLIELERWDEARTCFEALATNSEPDLRGFHGLGHLAALTGTKLEHGVAALKQYLGQRQRFGHPSHASAHFFLGRISVHRSETQAARKAFEAALALDPKYDDAKKALRRLR